MKAKLFRKSINFQLPFTILILMLLFCVEASFAMVSGIDATTSSQDLIEDILGAQIPTGFLASAGVPPPVGEEGEARSSTHYYYTTNGGPNDTIYEIDLTGALTGVTVLAGANFQGLAYVDDALGPGQDRLYGLDIVGSQLVEFDPTVAGIPPTGIAFPVPNADRACAGGNRRLFVQVSLATGNRILDIDPAAGAILNAFPTPAGGTVLFDGLAFDGVTLFGSEVIYPNSNIWLMDPNTGGLLPAPNPVNLPYWFAALGAESAPSAGGSINGKVINKLTGAPLGKVLVIAINAETKEKAWDITDADGYYEISDLEPGVYWVLCIKKGYKFGIKKVEVKAGEPTTVDFQLVPK